MIPGHRVTFIAILTTLAVAGGAVSAFAAEANGWAAVTTPTDGPARAIGKNANGCIAGAKALPRDADSYVVLRPRRNRYWGHPRTLAVIEDLARRATKRGEALMIADIGQPRGGPVSGHVSHQTGLDVDIRFLIVPRRQITEAVRDNPPDISMLAPDNKHIDRRWWTGQQVALVRAAALDPRVDRIFVHPVIKRELCRKAKGRPWLHKVVPWYDHDDHMHLRIACPADSPDCVAQSPIPKGNGCGIALAWWFTPEPYKRRAAKRRPPRVPPPACAAVLAGQ
jgi:penicillin-insensitive murein endopeptidase